MASYKSATLTITDDSHIDENRALRGGGLFNDSSTAVIQVTASTINGNSASTEAAGVVNSGGKLVIDTSVVSENAMIPFPSGGWGAGAGGIATPSGGRLTLRGCTISDNTGTAVGGLDNAGAAQIADSQITRNMGTLAGGVLNGLGGTMVVEDRSQIKDNSGALRHHPRVPERRRRVEPRHAGRSRLRNHR